MSYKLSIAKSLSVQEVNPPTTIIATNIDYGLIVQAVDRDFNVNRLERYLTICNAAKVNPVIILSKIDLINETSSK